jgi:hypothetical protein
VRPPSPLLPVPPTAHLFRENPILLEHPELIWNADETSTNQNGRLERVLGGRNEQQPTKVTSNSVPNATMISFVSPSGDYIAPTFLFPGTLFVKTPSWAPEDRVKADPVKFDAGYYKTKSGFMTSDAFTKVADFFAEKVKPRRKAIADELKIDWQNVPVLLICDGHESRMSVEVAQQLSDQGILLLILPPNCTPLLQALDFRIFGVYKQKLRTSVSAAQAANYAETLSILELVSLSFAPWEAAATPDRIKSAFDGTGVFPLNRDKVLKRLKESPAALVHDIDAAVAANKKKKEKETDGDEEEVPAPNPAPKRPRPPPLGSLKDDYPTGKDFKRARLDYINIADDKRFKPHLHFFFQQNWAVLGPHLANSLAFQADNIPDLPPLDDPAAFPFKSLPLIGEHIDDVLSLPRKPVFGRRRADDEDGDEEETGPVVRIRAAEYGVMTRPELIEEKKEKAKGDMEKKAQREEKRKINAEKKILAQAKRLEQVKAKKEARAREAPILQAILDHGLLAEEEKEEAERKRLTKKQLKALAQKKRLKVKSNAGREALLAALLEEPSVEEKGGPENSEDGSDEMELVSSP